MSEDLFFWVGGLFVAAIVFAGLKNKIANSPSAIVTGPGVVKTHDIECRFEAAGKRFGKLGQDRWSDGQERFSLVLRNLPDGGAPVKLYCGDRLVSEFEREGSKLEFRWKGMSSDTIPKFEIGDNLRIECSGLEFSGVVEPD